MIYFFLNKFPKKKCVILYTSKKVVVEHAIEKWNLEWLVIRTMFDRTRKKLESLSKMVNDDFKIYLTDEWLELRSI